MFQPTNETLVRGVRTLEVWKIHHKCRSCPARPSTLERGRNQWPVPETNRPIMQIAPEAYQEQELALQGSHGIRSDANSRPSSNAGLPRWALPSAGVRGHASEKEQTRCWLFATCVMGLEGIQGSCVSAQRWKGRIRSLLPLPATVSACFFSNQHRGPRRGYREQQPGNPFDRTEFFSKFWGPAASRETKWIHSPHIYIYTYYMYVYIYISYKP